MYSPECFVSQNLPDQRDVVEQLASPANLIGDLNPSRCAVLVVGRIQAASPVAAPLAELERRGYSIWRIESEGNSDLLRSQAVSEALERGFLETLWVDAQIEFDPNDVVKLRAHGLPLVSGVYPRRGGRGLDLELLPDTRRVELGIGGGLLEIQYAAAGFLHVRQEVYEAQRTRLHLPRCIAPQGPPFVPYFQPLVNEVSGANLFGSGLCLLPSAPASAASPSLPTRRFGCGGMTTTAIAGKTWAEARFDPTPASCESLRPRIRLLLPSRRHWNRLREPYQSPELKAFRRAHPWPEQKPAVPPREKEGWLFPSTQEMLARFLSNRTRLVVELGSWLGLSTRFIASRAPRRCHHCH